LKVAADSTHGSARADKPITTLMDVSPAPAPAAAAAAGLGVAKVQAQEAQQQVVVGPRVVGFLLLDPLWKGGEVVGYVTSVTRAACGAHPGEVTFDIDIDAASHGHSFIDSCRSFISSGCTLVARPFLTRSGLLH
jgi:hypothetical protein